MKKKVLIVLVIIISSLISLESCGPVVFSSRLGTPPPHWFYPNRVETVRYVYFPDYEIYYDFSLNNYLFCNEGDWLIVTILPKRFYGINLQQSKQVRITNYYGDNIKKYHIETIIKRRNSDPKRYH
jgi:hypothetical protein